MFEKNTKQKNINFAKQTNHISNKIQKQTKIPIFDLYMNWDISKHDNQGKWKWGDSRGFLDQEADIIHAWLNDFKLLTWKEILNQVSNGFYKHHYQDVCSINKEARKRLSDLKYDIFVDELFRFRQTGKKRLWGLVLANVFYLIWIDRNHKIYPVEKKHT